MAHDIWTMSIQKRAEVLRDLLLHLMHSLNEDLNQPTTMILVMCVPSVPVGDGRVAIDADTVSAITTNMDMRSPEVVHVLAQLLLGAHSDDAQMIIDKLSKPN